MQGQVPLIVAKSADLDQQSKSDSNHDNQRRNVVNHQVLLSKSSGGERMQVQSIPKTAFRRSKRIFG